MVLLERIKTIRGEKDMTDFKLLPEEIKLKTWKRYKRIWWPNWLIYHEPCRRTIRWKISECPFCMITLNYHKN